MKKFLSNAVGLLMLAPLALAGFMGGLHYTSVQAEAASKVKVELVSAPFSKMQWRFLWCEVLEVEFEKDGQKLVLHISIGDPLHTGVNSVVLDGILKQYGLVMSDLLVITHNHIIDAGALPDFSKGDNVCFNHLRKKGFKGSFRLRIVYSGGTMTTKIRQNK